MRQTHRPCHKVGKKSEVCVRLEKFLAEGVIGGMEDFYDAGNIDLGVFRLWVIAMNQQRGKREQKQKGDVFPLHAAFLNSWNRESPRPHAFAGQSGSTSLGFSSQGRSRGAGILGVNRRS